MNEKNTLYIVVPCYKEQEVLPETSRRLREKMRQLMDEGKISRRSRVMFVNDGSSDNTWAIISELHEKEPEMFSGVNLSRNRGHQNALLAGLLTARERRGYDRFRWTRICRTTSTPWMRWWMITTRATTWFTACAASAKPIPSSSASRRRAFTRLMKALGVDIVFNHADYRLMSRRAVEGLAQFTEVNLFLRGIVPQIGYKWTTVTYERAERFAGESKYPLKKMIAFAADGITSFSVKPIRLVFSTGVVVFIVSLIMLIYALVAKLAGHTSVGWTSLMGSIWLIGGIQLLGLGVVGEYIGKIYNETKRRPRFIIESVLNKADNE